MRLPVSLIQQQLGHANLSVTSKYLDHVAPQERVEALKGRGWGCMRLGLAVEVKSERDKGETQVEPTGNGQEQRTGGRPYESRPLPVANQ